MRVTVIGSGPGGYSAAMRASQLGAEVFLVEKEHLGGVCLNKGCIPSKSFLRSAEICSLFKRAEEFGIFPSISFHCNFEKIVERKNKIVNRLRMGMESSLRRQDIFFVAGLARIATPNIIYIDTSNGGPEIIETDKIIIASGSEDIILPFLDFKEERILSSSEVFDLNKLPESVIILGAGPVGIELTCIFNSFGVDVTLIELLPQILPLEDLELAQSLQHILQLRGVRVFTETKVEKIDCGPKYVTAHLASEVNVVGELLISCAGRKPHLANLGLENVDILIEREAILVNEKMETNVSDIYTVGDVVGKAMVAHVASFEGLIAAENALGGEETVDYSVIPNCIYSFPEIASVGMTKEKAKELGYKVKMVKYPLLASGRAYTLGETEGFIQIVVDVVSYKVLGCQMMGYGATEIIHEAALAIKSGITAKDLANLIHAHPTLSESFMEMARNIYGKGIYVL